MMGQSEALLIARRTLAKAHNLEFVSIMGKSYMIPKDRNVVTGKANKEEDQEGADAYNWFAHEFGKSAGTTIR